MLPDFTPLDYLVLGLYAASWFGYALFADFSRWHERSIMKLMDDYRRRWMREMLRRDNRIVDTNIVASLQNGAAFFASTTVFAVGGLIAALGASEQSIALISTLPFAQPGSTQVWQAKVLLMVFVLSYAFFKFAWTFRLQNYCQVLLGAAPVETGPAPEAEAHAERAAKISALAAWHFNRGLRAYFFALAALTWFIHPLLFGGTILYVLYVLYRREFRSRSLKALRETGVVDRPGDRHLGSGSR